MEQELLWFLAKFLSVVARWVRGDLFFSYGGMGRAVKYLDMLSFKMLLNLKNIILFGTKYVCLKTKNNILNLIIFF